MCQSDPAEVPSGKNQEDGKEPVRTEDADKDEEDDQVEDDNDDDDEEEEDEFDTSDEEVLTKSGDLCQSSS